MYRDTNLPPIIDDFSEKFANMKMTSLMDFFSSYNQILFNKRDRDKIIFYIFFGLVRQITLPQKTINSI